jgi:hypothetical protein
VLIYVIFVIFCGNSSLVAAGRAVFLRGNPARFSCVRGQHRPPSPTHSFTLSAVALAKADDSNLEIFDKTPCIFQNNVVISHSMKSEIITLGRTGFGSRRSAGGPSPGIRARVPPAEFAGPAPPTDFNQGKSNENQTKSD